MDTTTSVLPTVHWGKHKIIRLLVGHNPIKGGSQWTPELSEEMADWHKGTGAIQRRLTSCEANGINTVQRGGPLSTVHKEPVQPSFEVDPTLADACAS